MKIFHLLFILLILSSCNAQNGHTKLKTNIDNNTLLWEISGNNLSSPSYLFGSFHLLCKDDIRFSASLLKAVKLSREIYLELKLDDPSILLSGMMLMNMNGGKKLKDLYLPAAYKKLEDFFRDSLKTPLMLFPSMKPAFLESMLYPKMMPCKSISGVEEELMVVAKNDKKEIKGLETMAFQAAVFDSIPYIDQAKELLHSIDSLTAWRKYFDTLINVYKSQRLQEIEKLFSRSEFGMEENQELLLNSRNRNWVNLLKTIMKNGPIFIAVGAGHLVGEQGLIELLKKAGYNLRPIENLVTEH